MRKQDVDYFKRLLTGQLAELLRQSDDTPSTTTVGSQDFAGRIKDRENKLIDRIRKALGRIDDGTFGICEQCGENIPLERMKARPVTTQCIECRVPDDVA